MPYKFKPGLVTVSQSGKALKLDGLAVPSGGSDVTKNYVDQQDAETLAGAKEYTVAELSRAVETQAAKDAEQDAEIRDKQPAGDYATSAELAQAVETQAAKDKEQDAAIANLTEQKVSASDLDVATPDMTQPVGWDAVKKKLVTKPGTGSGGGPANAAELAATVPAGLPPETEKNVQAVLDSLGSELSGVNTLIGGGIHA